MKILVTGCVGFIGWKVSERLIDAGHIVIGVDNINDYYDVKLKEWRLNNLLNKGNFIFHKVDIEDKHGLKQLFEEDRFDGVINLAARAGVRYSIENPTIYFTTNVIGSLNLLELIKDYGIKKYILASTSSLYAGQKMPFKENLPVNNPISPYAASKKSAEIMAYTYHYLYGIDVTILRYFTVYGPAGRPDMSIFRLIYWALKDEVAEIFGDGTQSRDFTYVDDIAEGTIKALKPLGFEIINLGNNNPHTLNEVIAMIEKYTGKTLKKEYKEFNKADLKATWADISKAKNLLNWKPDINLEEGIKMTVEWMVENWGLIKEIKISKT